MSKMGTMKKIQKTGKSGAREHRGSQCLSQQTWSLSSGLLPASGAERLAACESGATRSSCTCCSCKLILLAIIAGQGAVGVAPCGPLLRPAPAVIHLLQPALRAPAVLALMRQCRLNEDEVLIGWSSVVVYKKRRNAGRVL